jgi:sigma-E factor negative regulatory protein RseA
MMSDRLGESLSALMDDEVSEFELHQILKGNEKEQLRQTWFRYHTSRAALRNEHSGIVATELSTRILDSLDAEPEHSQSWLARNWLKPLASTAVAASVAAVVVFGAQQVGQENVVGNDSALNQIAASEVTGSANSSSSVGLQAGDHSMAVGFGASTATGTVKPGDVLTVAKQQKLEGRFNRYMLLHAEHAALNTSHGMMPFARVASFEVE